MNKMKLTLATLILPILAANFMAMGMEKEQSKNVRPLIKAIVYLNPEKPAFYATNKQLEFLNEKGIATPILPIVREVAEVKVSESNGSTTNWLQQPTISIKDYEKEQLKRKTLSFGQQLHNNLNLESKTFPKYLPVELSFNCSNNSKIGLTIDTFPVQVTFASNKNFETEQNNCMEKFYYGAWTQELSKSEIQQLTTDGRIDSTTMTRSFVGNLIPPITVNVITHKEESYASEQGCYQKIIDNKIHPHKNTFHYLKRREAGLRPQRRLNPEPDLDAILSGCLKEIELNSSK